MPLAELTLSRQPNSIKPAIDIIPKSPPKEISVSDIKTITGRTQLWFYLWEKISEHPILGYGYGAFWGVLGGPSETIWAKVTWKPPHGHNGLLDLCAELGLVGVVLFFMGFISIFRSTISSIQNKLTLETFYPFIFLISFMIINSIESFLVRQNSIFWVIYVSTIFTTIKNQEFRGIQIELR